MKIAVAKALFNSHDYHEYRKLIADLLLQEKSTGNQQSETLTNYSGLNDTRMSLLDQTLTISETNIQKLKSLNKRYIWLVLAEGWCTDSAQILPVLNKMAEESGIIELKIALPEENEELMRLIQVDGISSIPKLIVVDKETGAVYGTWGSRPKKADDLIKEYKAKNGKIDEAANADLLMFYIHDKGISVQEELISLMFDLEERHK